MADMVLTTDESIPPDIPTTKQLAGLGISVT